MEESILPSIFDYLDYRTYLNDAFQTLKNGSRRFSWRSFANLAGYSTPNFLKLVIERKLNLTLSSIEGTAGALKLNKQERTFFEALVGYDQAKTHEEKNRYYQLILRNRKYTSIKELDKDQYEYYSHWYNPVVRELVVHPDYSGQEGWITKQIIPAVSDAQVKKSIELLIRLGLIRQDNGKWVQSDQVISSSTEAASLALKNFHQTSCSLAAEALNRFSSQERDFRFVSVGLSQKGYEEVKQRLISLWQETLDFAKTEKQADRIYQINLQMFPLTTKEKQ